MEFSIFKKGKNKMEKMKELYAKVTADNALQEKFNGILGDAENAGEETTNRKLLDFAKEAGFDVTVEEMKAFFKELTEKKEGELSDSELDAVAGGKTGIGITLSLASIGIGCATSSAAVAAMGQSCKDFLNQ